MSLLPIPRPRAPLGLLALAALPAAVFGAFLPGVPVSTAPAVPRAARR